MAKMQYKKCYFLKVCRNSYDGSYSSNIGPFEKVEPAYHKILEIINEYRRTANSDNAPNCTIISGVIDEKGKSYIEHHQDGTKRNYVFDCHISAYVDPPWNKLYLLECYLKNKHGIIIPSYYGEEKYNFSDNLKHIEKYKHLFQDDSEDSIYRRTEFEKAKADYEKIIQYTDKLIERINKKLRKTNEK